MDWVTYVAVAAAVLEALIILARMTGLGGRRLRVKPGRKYMIVLVHGNPPRWELYELDREESPLGFRTRDGYYVYERVPGLRGVEETQPMRDDRYAVFHNDLYGDLVKVEARRPPDPDPKKKVIVVDAYSDPVLKAIREMGHKDVFDAVMDYVEDTVSKVKAMALKQARTYMTKMRDFTDQVIEWANSLEAAVEMKSKAKLMTVAGETQLKASAEVSSAADDMLDAMRGSSEARRKLLGIIEAKMGKEMADQMRNAQLQDLVDLCVKYKYISEDEANKLMRKGGVVPDASE